VIAFSWVLIGENRRQPGSLFQPALSPLPGFDLHAHYHSLRIGGDYFDASVVGSRVVFLLTDIAGRRAAAHGIAAVVQDTLRQRVQDLFPRCPRCPKIGSSALSVQAGGPHMVLLISLARYAMPVVGFGNSHPGTSSAGSYLFSNRSGVVFLVYSTTDRIYDSNV
jgi:hypothetical protein